MKDIVQDGAPVLREMASPVPEALFGSEELSRLVADMSEALDREPDGVAIAAPQIGVSYRIFVVRIDRVMPPPPNPEAARGASPPERAAQNDVFINPEVIKVSRRRQKADEGCLSVRGVYGTTSRHERVTVRARHENGTSFTRGGGGLLAQIFEHEVDHLNGILFIDHAEHLVELPPEGRGTQSHAE